MAEKILTGKDWQKFPTKIYPKKNIRDYLKESNPNYNIINKKTKISSMGSCFAGNIADYLIKNKYNYLIKEEETIKRKNQKSSADWGAVYNIPCIRQIIQYSYEDFNPIERWWKDKKDPNIVIDPFRRDIGYRYDEKEKLFGIHRNKSRNALSESDVLILTIGMTEIWRHKDDKSTFWRVVPMHLYNDKNHEFYIMNTEDCINELSKIKGFIDKYNSKCKLILTVSPVSFFATFRKDVDAVSANLNSKSTIKSAVDWFVRNNNNVFYFPSYEFVTLGNDNPYKDGRHVKDSLINEVMNLFEMYFTNQRGK